MTRATFTVDVRPGDGRINGRAVMFGRGDRKRIGKSAQYRGYVGLVGLAARAVASRAGMFRGGLLGVAITFHVERQRHLFGCPPDMALADLDVDASIKATLDGLQDGGLVDDDARFIEVHARKRYDKERPRVSIAVWTVDPGG